ncbi:hypothetical protein [Ruminococcus flavefaciens]|uniref:hypothetical protein n=1 Tax=Ruminococcus flavefaciens TaxID=1265 RepID=UPI00048E4432|nr:hypothetical protein [Ruminococcus flavefaciens]
MKNVEIRSLIKQNRLFYYEVAEKIGIAEATFCKWLRKELTADQKQKVLFAINELSGRQYGSCN